MTVSISPTLPHVTIYCSLFENGSEYDIDKGCWDKLWKITKVPFFQIQEENREKATNLYDL